MSALLLYDTILTMALEGEVVWCRRVTLGSVLHIMNRYCELGAYVAALILLYPMSDAVRSLLGCNTQHRTDFCKHRPMS